MRFLREIANIIISKHTMKQKLNYLKYRSMKKAEELGYAPLTVSVVSTSRCTLSCDMCPTHSKKVSRDYSHIQKASRDMSMDMFKKIIDRFDSALSVHIIGSGEPMLNKDFFEMVNYAANKKMKVKTFSNGTTIEGNLDNLLRSKLDGITISINGYSPEEFTRMTGMGGQIYKDICAATKKLTDERNKRRSGLKIKVSHIIDKYNYKFIPDMIKVSMNLGADNIFLCNFLACPYEGLTADERLLEANKGIIDEIKYMRSKFPVSVIRKVTFPALVDKNLAEDGCSSHFTQIRVDGDGNASSCSMMLLDMTGHGRYDDMDVWNNEFFRRMRKAFLPGNVGLVPEPCKVCPDNKGMHI